MPRIDFDAEDTELLGEVISALALVILDEVNLLRQEHALPERTRAQLKAAVKQKVRDMRSA